MEVLSDQGTGLFYLLTSLCGSSIHFLVLFALQVVEHCSCIGDLERVWAGVLHDAPAFHEHLLNDHIVNNSAISPRSLSKASLALP